MKIRPNDMIRARLDEASTKRVERTSTFEELMDAAVMSGDMTQDSLDEEDDDLSEYSHSFEDSDFEIDEDVELNEEEDKSDKPTLMSDEDLRIESLKIAQDICAQMENVLPEDIVNTADEVANFIRNFQLSLEGASTEEKKEGTAAEVKPEDFANSVTDDARTSEKASDTADSTTTETEDNK